MSIHKEHRQSVIRPISVTRTRPITGPATEPAAVQRELWAARCLAGLAGLARSPAASIGGATASLAVAILILLAFFVASSSAAQSAKRIVVIKADGLPDAVVDRLVNKRDPRTGKSMLPWIDHIFYKRGTRLANFYVRGMSLSAPAWSLLDTGQHLQIKGNVEFDRFTLHSYDYLNFIPFYISNAAQRRVDMPGPELLDQLGIPLLIDAYPFNERHQSFQLLQRGTRWLTLQRALQNRFTTRRPQQLLDELTLGIEGRSILLEQMERELLDKLKDSRIRYLDYYLTDYDHAAHHNRDRQTHVRILQEIDAVIGRIWTAIQESAPAADTVLILVSDHGTNSDERFYSQGYNLVKLLGSRLGGAHHVVTKRRLLLDYSIKGIYPLVPLIYTTTEDSYYLKGQSTLYPTALLDFDGNERASIHLRDSNLNVLHILLQQLQAGDLPAATTHAATNFFLQILERRRADWSSMISELHEELGALRRLIGQQQAVVGSQPKKWSAAETAAGVDQDARRIAAHLTALIATEQKYTEYARTLANLLALRPTGGGGPDEQQPDLRRVKIEDAIAKGAMGEPNTIHKLQNYVVGVAPGGLTLHPDGTLDWERSFVRTDYFQLLHDITVRNNPQPLVSNHPVDFIAANISPNDIAKELKEMVAPAEEITWLYGGADHQALVLSRYDRDDSSSNDGGGSRERLLLRYLPVKRLRQDAAGTIRFEQAQWAAGFPLKIWEDPHVQVPAGTERAAWLAGWHTDLEFLQRLHRTQYANAVVGIHEQFGRHLAEAINPDQTGLSADGKLLRRFRRRQRHIVETDLFVHASDHWNFDVRGFNPGGNHGSFRRIATHSALMLAGGANTPVPHATVINTPYDSLSFAPTVFALAGQLDLSGRPSPSLQQRGFRSFPGRIIKEIFQQPGRQLSNTVILTTNVTAQETIATIPGATQEAAP